MRATQSRWLLGLGLLVGALAFGWAPAARELRAVQVVTRLSRHAAASASASAADGVQTEELSLKGRGGPIRARLYFPAGAEPGDGVVVAHGVHYRGIDEGRLVPFARALAESGFTVLTPELSQLADYHLTFDSVEVIRDSVAYLARRHDHVAGSQVRLVGFSFAGGLSLVALEDAATAARVSAVTSVGGHHDLRRVLRFLIHNEIETPSGIVHQQAQEYGLVVIVYENLEHFVPAQDLPAMRAGFQAWLHEDQQRARALAKRRTTPEAERLWQLLEKGQLQSLAPELDALLEGQRQELARLSPAGHLRALHVPVFLLHGAHDSVIPPSETDAASRELQGLPHEALVSPLVEHVELRKKAKWAERLSLVSFLAQAL